MVKYSLIVPAYNEEKRIANCLKSLKAQSFKDFEIIVVDNNSQDSTREISSIYVKNIIFEEKQGYLHAVNTGVKKAKGKFVGVCDADCRYPIDWLLKIDEQFSNDNSLVAVYGSAGVYDCSLLTNEIIYLLYNLFLTFSRKIGLDNITGFNFVFRRKIFLQIGGYDPTFQKAGLDVRLGKEMKKVGKLSLNTGIRVDTSFRRFKDNGILRELVANGSVWISLVQNKEPNLSYKEYNYRVH